MTESIEETIVAAAEAQVIWERSLDLDDPADVVEAHRVALCAALVEAAEAYGVEVVDARRMMLDFLISVEG